MSSFYPLKNEIRMKNECKKKKKKFSVQNGFCQLRDAME